MVGDDVDDAFAALEAATDQHRRSFPGNLAEPRPAALGDHDIDQAGLVLEVEERDALSGHGALTVGDHTGHLHDRAGLRIPQLRRRQHTECAQLLAYEDRRMAIG